MKKILFLSILFLMLITVKQGYAQNAFYDAKRIVRSGEPDTIIKILLGYKEVGENEDEFWTKVTKKYKDIESILSKYSISNRARFQEILDNRSIIDTFKAFKNHIPPELGKLKKAIDTFYEIERKYKNARSKLSEIKKRVAADTVDHEEEVTSNLQAELMDANDAVIYLKTKYDQQRKAVNDCVTDKALRTLFRRNSDSMDGIQREGYTKYFSAEIETEIKNNQIAFQEASGKANELIAKIPTQSEMIDAMAIYLAKRVKQEAAIAFVEKLHENIRDEAILNRLFPNTLKLLNNRDAYTKPNFGTSWKIALFEDFKNIPDSLSACLPPKYGIMANFIADGVKIGTLVHQHYSFVEAVNYLQENPFKVDELKFANFVVHMINTELFNAEKNANYWISAEVFQRMSDEQLKWMLILLDLKYGKELLKQMPDTWLIATSHTGEMIRQKIKPVKNWITRMLVAMNHYENMLRQDSKTDDEKKVKLILTDYWKFQSDLISIVLDESIVKLPKGLAKSLSFTDCVFKIYSGFDSKNYAQIVDQLFKLFSMLEIDRKVDLKRVVFNKNLGKLLEQRKPAEKAYLNKILERLNLQYAEISSSDFLIGILNDIEKVRALGKTHHLGEILQTNIDSVQPKASISNIIFDTKAESDILKQLFEPEKLTKLEASISNTNDAQLLNRIRSLYAEHQELIISTAQLFVQLDSFIDAANYKNKQVLKIDHHFMKDVFVKKFVSPQAETIYAVLNKMQDRSQYQKIRTTISFLSDVMQAENSADLSKVIESYALPVSSYKLKRNSRMSITLDALVGVYGGWEYVRTTDPNNSIQCTWGVSAPIGVSFSRGVRCSFDPSGNQMLGDNEYAFLNRRGKFKKLTGNNFTVMLSIVDIGAVVSYRITNDQEDGLPKDAKWSQFLAPGITFLRGIPGLPLCIGTGARFTPQLRTLKTGEQRNAFRWDVGIYFDLPLMNVHYKK